MCTITYFPDSEYKKSFIVTDNRDELINRPAAFPAIYRENNALLYYPKDLQKGGTWMGISNKKRIMCLMNGAFGKYERKPVYRKSRGIVLKELLVLEDLAQAMLDYDFRNIEPFFSLVFDWENRIKIWEFVWDGGNRFMNPKDASQPAVWSSAMLYSKEQQQKKQNRFFEFLNFNKNRITAESIWAFHHRREKEYDGGFLIDRGQLGTTSISQIHLSETGSFLFRFHDLVNDREQMDEINLTAYP